MFEVFNNPRVVAQSWYVAARSRHVPRGRIRVVEMLGRRIALYRAASNRVHAIDATCPHLGADLGLGRVAGEEIECAFHHWRFAGDGTCVAAPGCAEPPSRRARAYPAVDRWGFVWLFNGPRATFDLPECGYPRGRSIALPPQRIRCHPHVVLANGLDVRHYETLHGFEFTAAPVFDATAPHELSLELCGRPRSRALQRLTGTRKTDLRARFVTVGGSFARIVAHAPTRFEVLFTGRPDADGACDTQTLVFVPNLRPLALARAAAILAHLLHADRRLLDTIRFHPGFVETDAALRTYAETVDAMPTW